MDQTDERRLLGEVLKAVSRSFYLTIRVLPYDMRLPVATAYLLARAADTIADSRALPPSQRLERLLAFRALVQGPWNQEEIACITAGAEGRYDGVSPGEAALLSGLGPVFGLLETLPQEDRRLVRQVVVTLTRGMEFDLTAFPAEDSGSLAALKAPEELDCYTYLVAGCVGGFWTSLAMAHEPCLAHWDSGKMNALGIRFGKALQLTNALRDVPRDLRIGRCYLPEQDLALIGLAPGSLLYPGNSPVARDALKLWIRAALEHFGAAEAYLLALPRRCLRLRLAALWPVLLGLATLEKLAGNGAWLDPSRPSRVRRKWVYWMMARSLAAAPFDVLLRFWIRRLRGKVESALDRD